MRLHGISHFLIVEMKLELRFTTKLRERKPKHTLVPFLMHAPAGLLYLYHLDVNYEREYHYNY